MVTPIRKSSYRRRSSEQQHHRAASNNSREQQQQQRAAAAIAAAVVNPTYPPVHPYVLSNVYPACISRMYLPYLECISVNISYLSRMISQYRARHSYKKSLQSCIRITPPHQALRPACTTLKQNLRHHPSKGAATRRPTPPQQKTIIFPTHPPSGKRGSRCGFSLRGG